MQQLNLIRISSCLFMLLLTGTGCLLKKNNNTTQEQKKQEARMDDIEARVLHEFNMTKDPATGRIPEGIRERELAQVKAVLAQNSLTTPTVANAYSFQGPNNLGGRTRALAYDIRFDGAANMVLMAGGVSGGIFKSVDDGATWVRKSPLGDLFNVTALAQDTRVGFRDTWYYGGGEFSGNSTSATGASYRGKGVYKSTDNGETWTFLPLSNTGVLETFDHRADYIQKIVVDPTTGNVYMAVVDAIYRSTDGGTTWGIVLTSGSGGFSTAMPTDIVVTSTGRFYAAFAGGSNTAPTNMPGVWSSTTGASGSWTKIAGAGSGTSPAGWNASGAYGRVVLAFAPSLDSRLYALYWNGISFTCGSPAPEAELFRWDDGISTWTELTANLPDEAGCLAGNDPFAVQGGYDLVIAVKPDDPDAVYIGGTNIYRSTTGFTTTAATTRIGGYASPASYSLYTSSHPDIHAIAFRPGVSTTMLCGNDGGIQRTTANLAATVVWSQINTGYRTYQYYHVALDPRAGNAKVFGGAQDNGSTRNIGGSGTSFELAYGGDGVSVGLSDLISGSTYEYCGSQQGNIVRRNSASALGAVTTITPTGEGGTSTEQFVTVFKLDNDNTQNLYYANDNALYRTTSASTITSATWTSLTGVATSVGAANDITAMATTRGTYSAATASLFMGTTNSKVYRLNDPAAVAAATAPVDISGAGFPAGAYVSSIAVNPRNDDTVLVTLSNYGVSGIWWTGTANSAVPTWTAIEGNIPLPSVRSSAIVVNGTTVEYYVGTSVGLYSTTAISGGTTVWAQEGVTDIGNAVVGSLALRAVDNTMVIGTHGYGMWNTTIGPVLPVKLTSFTGRAEKKYNVLNWEVASEINNKGFYLERKQKGDINYIPIGFINGRGNSSTPKSYTYQDISLDLSSEQALYRLKQVDFDGRYTYSDVVLLKRTASGKLVEYIAADASTLLIRINSITSDNIRIRIVDMSGREMYRQQTTALTQRIPVANWAAGTYAVEVWRGNQRAHVQQFVKP
jgi:hypothetical protein